MTKNEERRWYDAQNAKLLQMIAQFLREQLDFLHLRFYPLSQGVVEPIDIAGFPLVD